MSSTSLYFLSCDLTNFFFQSYFDRLFDPALQLWRTIWLKTWISRNSERKWLFRKIQTFINFIASMDLSQIQFQTSLKIDFFIKNYLARLFKISGS